MPGDLRVDQEQRNAVALALAAAGARGDEQMRRPRRGIDHRLVAVEHIARAVLLRGGAQIGEIVAPLRFGIGKGDDRLARDDFAE